METTYTEHLAPGQKIYVYWRFEHPNRRWRKATVLEVHDNYIVVDAVGRIWEIGPETHGGVTYDKLYLRYDKRGRPYLSGAYGLSAKCLEVHNSLGGAPWGVYGGRVFIHHEDTWE